MGLDGYPTEGQLKTIKEWDVSNKGFFGLVDYLEPIWWAADWGFIKYTGRDHLHKKKALKLELHTGGWSGNEDIIEALQQNFIFWTLSWRMTRAGGHYYFEIPFYREQECKTK